MLRIGLCGAIYDGTPARALMFASWLARELASAGDVAESIALCRDMLTRYADVDERSTVLQFLRMSYASLLLRQGTAGRQEALDVLWNSYTIVDGQMEEALLDERRGEFAAKWIRVIEMLISLLLDHGETLAIPGGADPRLLAFGIHEAAKARGSSPPWPAWTLRLRPRSTRDYATVKPNSSAKDATCRRRRT